MDKLLCRVWFVNTLSPKEAKTWRHRVSADVYCFEKSWGSEPLAAIGNLTIRCHEILNTGHLIYYIRYSSSGMDLTYCTIYFLYYVPGKFSAQSSMPILCMSNVFQWGPRSVASFLSPIKSWWLESACVLVEIQLTTNLQHKQHFSPQHRFSFTNNYVTIT